MLDGPERTEVRGFERFCLSQAASGTASVSFGGRLIGLRRNVFRAAASFLCHEGNPAQTDPARQRLNATGVRVPPCRGTVSSFKENRSEVVLALVCGEDGRDRLPGSERERRNQLPWRPGNHLSVRPGLPAAASRVGLLLQAGWLPAGYRSHRQSTSPALLFPLVGN